MDQLVCRKCQISKDVSGFYKKNGKSDTTWCKECYREWHRQRYVPKHGTSDEPRNCERCGVSYQPKSRRFSIFCSRECLAKNRTESGKEREQHLQRKYGIGAADYDRMLAEQDGGCAICSVKPEGLTAGRYRTYLHVDHDHETGANRGLLCPDHNMLLGRFGDSAEMFRKVVAYLDR
jgi:hypothetical protein